MADSASSAPAAALAEDSASSSSSSSATARAAPASAFAHLLPPWFARTVEAYLADDAPAFDIGGLVVGDAPQTAQLLGKTRGVLAGVPFVDAVFAHLGCSVEWLLAEGAVVEPVAVVARVRGPARKILLGERTALNILARASGIATQARRLSDLARAHGWHGEVAGTRKITPGFRLVEKYALLVGGCSTHRMDLSSMVMLKDNHVWAAGGIREAVAAARRAAGFSTKIEVEARNLAEAREAAAAGADVVMLDNYEPPALARDSAELKREFPHVLIEASGGIRETTLTAFCLPTVDVLSMGSLTQGYDCLDFSLKIASGEGAAALERAEAKRARELASAAATGGGGGGGVEDK